MRGSVESMRGSAGAYQGGGDAGVETQQPHVTLHAAVHHQLVLPSHLPHQLPVDCGDRGTCVGSQRPPSSSDASARTWPWQCPWVLSAPPCCPASRWRFQGPEFSRSCRPGPGPRLGHLLPALSSVMGGRGPSLCRLCSGTESGGQRRTPPRDRGCPSLAGKGAPSAATGGGKALRAEGTVCAKARKHSTCDGTEEAGGRSAGRRGESGRHPLTRQLRLRLARHPQPTAHSPCELPGKEGMTEP